jgi:hypothetical protein
MATAHLIIILGFNWFYFTKAYTIKKFINIMLVIIFLVVAL